MRVRRAIVGGTLLVASLMLAGCQEGGIAGGLRAAGVGTTPDEFMVLPTRPLEMPEDLTALPPPTPGRPSRVDPRPQAEAIAGLTGRPAPAAASGGALVARAGPIDPAIRTELAQEDAAWRQTHHGLFFQRLFAGDQEELIYRPMVLDPATEFDRLRAAGVRVPAAPPAVLGQ